MHDVMDEPGGCEWLLAEKGGQLRNLILSCNLSSSLSLDCSLRAHGKLILKTPTENIYISLLEKTKLENIWK